ncbi:MAG: MG2 domain-containing protein, partial [Halocynthiibacter sp.]
MRNFLKALFILTAAAAATPLWSETPVPERRLSLTRDLDFFGADLQNIFDTTLQSCQRTCLSDADCAGFTFNTESNACFPKSAVTDTVPYDGAISGRVYVTGAAVLAGAGQRKAELGFLTAADFAAAHDLATGLPNLYVSGEWTAQNHLDSAEARKSDGEFSSALAFTGAALNLDDRTDIWIEYGRLALLVAGQDSNQRNLMRQRALAASVNGYLRALGPGTRVNALALMSEALELRGRGRDMIPPLRLAQVIQPRVENALALDDAIGKYGFRVTDTTVDNDAARPRICAIFSEDLIQAGRDYTPFVQLPQTGLEVGVDGAQLCVDGVEHGARYRIVLREGLPAASGETLYKSVELNLYVRDRGPSLRFSGRAYVLPKSGDAALPIETVNLSEVDLKLRRVSDRNILRAMQDGYFGRPMSYWQEESFASEIAEDIWSGTGIVNMELNRDMTTRLPMGEVIGGLPPGIYALQASVPGGDGDIPTATQWFVLSDLGVATLSGVDGLHVFVRGLGDAEPKPGLEVTLLSRANAPLGTAVTDARGYAVFDAALTSGQGSAAPALVTVADGDRDIVFLSLNEPGFDLSDRGVEGRAPASAIDVFLSTDRGAYRAGETVFATALARDGQAAALSGLPVTAVLTRPDGVEYSRMTSAQGRAGGHVFELPIIASAPRGTWRLALYADPDAAPLADTRFLVEDFLPERIDFTMMLPLSIIPLSLRDRPPLSIAARYLFGAPGAGLSVEGEVQVRTADGNPRYPGYVFGRYDVALESRVASLPSGQKTNEKGGLVLPVTFPQFDPRPDRPVQARITVRVSEGSGRPVERELTVLLAPDGPMIGIKPLFDGVVAEGAEAAFSLIAVGAAEQTADMRVGWAINRVQTRYQWYSLYGNWNWEPVTTRTRIASGELDLTGAPVSVSAPVDWGRYEIKIERLDGGPYTAASTEFYAGWYAPADASATPDT